MIIDNCPIYLVRSHPIRTKIDSGDVCRFPSECSGYPLTVLGTIFREHSDMSACVTWDFDRGTLGSELQLYGLGDDWELLKNITIHVDHVFGDTTLLLRREVVQSHVGKVIHWLFTIELNGSRDEQFKVVGVIRDLLLQLKT